MCTSVPRSACSEGPLRAGEGAGACMAASARVCSQVRPGGSVLTEGYLDTPLESPHLSPLVMARAGHCPGWLEVPGSLVDMTADPGALEFVLAHPASSQPWQGLVAPLYSGALVVASLWACSVGNWWCLSFNYTHSCGYIVVSCCFNFYFLNE